MPPEVGVHRRHAGAPSCPKHPSIIVFLVNLTAVMTLHDLSVVRSLWPPLGRWCNTDQPFHKYIYDVMATYFCHTYRPYGPYPHSSICWLSCHFGYRSVHPHFVRISHNNIFLRMISHNYTLCSLARTFCERLVQHSRINITNMLGVTPLAARCHWRALVHGKLIHVPSHVI